MKVIGEGSIVTEEGIKKFKAIVTENNGLYDIEVYEQFNNGIQGENLLLGQWASTIGSAKRRINQGTILKSKDWDWKTI